MHRRITQRRDASKGDRSSRPRRSGRRANDRGRRKPRGHARGDRRNLRRCGITSFHPAPHADPRLHQLYRSRSRYRFVKRGENPLLADRASDAMPLHVRSKIRRDAREHDTDLSVCEFVEQVAHGLRGGVVDVGDRAGIDDEPADRHRRAVDEIAHLVGKEVGVGVKQIRTEAIDNEPRLRSPVPASPAPASSGRSGPAQASSGAGCSCGERAGTATTRWPAGFPARPRPRPPPAR